MAKLSGLQVHIATKVDGCYERCEEWADPNANEEFNLTTRYIVIKSNEPYWVFYHIPIGYVFSSDVLAFHITADGVFAGGHRVPPTHTWPTRSRRPSEPIRNEGNIIHSYIQPVHNERDNKEPFRFPTLGLNVHDLGVSATDADVKFWAGEEILVKVFPAKSHAGSEHSTEFRHTATAGDDALTFSFRPRPVSVLHRILHPDAAPLNPMPPVQTEKSTDPGSIPTNIAYREQLPENSQDLLYCRCRKITANPVVTCDNDACEVGTWHMFCVGIKEQPTRFPWLCPECRVMPKDKLVFDGLGDRLD